MITSGSRSIGGLAVLLLLAACGSSGGAARSGPIEPVSVSPRSAPAVRGVRIAPDVFAFNPKLSYSNEHILVSGPFPRSLGLAALRRVELRFLLVDETGVEHASVEGFPPIGADGKELYTPNYVADPTVEAGGIVLYVDCKGAIELPMRRRFIQILNEELRELGPVTVTTPDFLNTPASSTSSGA